MDPRRGALVFPECGVAKPRDLEQCDTSCALEATLRIGELLSSHYLSYGRGHSQLRDLLMHRWPLLEGNALKAMWVPVLSHPFGWWEGRSNKNDGSYDEFRLSTTGHSMWPDGKPLSARKAFESDRD